MKSALQKKWKKRVNEVMTGRSGRWGKKTGGKRIGGKVGDGGANGDKIKKTLNKKDGEGNCLCCKICKSIRHMKEICKDKHKEDNRAGNNGEALRYIYCDSKKHLLPHCPYSSDQSSRLDKETNFFFKSLSEIVSRLTTDISYFLNGSGVRSRSLDLSSGTSIETFLMERLRFLQ